MFLFSVRNQVALVFGGSLCFPVRFQGLALGCPIRVDFFPFDQASYLVLNQSFLLTCDSHTISKIPIQFFRCFYSPFVWVH